MNGLYSVITDSTYKGGGGALGSVQGIDASRNVSRGGQTPGGPKNICEKGSQNFLCRLKNMLKYAHRVGGGGVGGLECSFDARRVFSRDPQID